MYYFAGKFFIQQDSGPIGLRSTACLAALIMKLWDSTWLKLAERDKFQFSEMWEKEDLQSGLSDTHRTMKELTSAMSSLVSFIQFEGEEPGMFPGNKLPTLDTAVWWNGKTLMYEFYEKPTVPNRVLQKDTALAESAIRSSLNQEVVRRMFP